MSRTYTRDGMGNVTTTGGIALPDPLPAVTDYTIASGSNRLSNSLGPKNRYFTHDGAGNITSDGTWSYVYNDNNRMEQVKAAGAVVATYAYDGFERRVNKIAGGVTTHYHYDLNGRLIAETDGAGNPIRDYVYIDGEPVAMQVYGAGAGWYWFLNDYLGTPQKLVDDAGALVWQAVYMPFGEARILTADVENNLRFPGQYFDAETGFHYNWHRYYDPGTGRYLRPDPIGLEGGVNVYVYALNNPANLIDPFGLTTTIIPGGTSAPFPGVHPVFQPGTPQNQLISDDLLFLVGLMDPRPLLKDIVDLFGAKGEGYCQARRRGRDPKILQPRPGDLGPLAGSPGLNGWEPPSGDPHKDGSDFWKKPSNWDKMSKWQKFRWWTGKIGGALTGAGGAGV